MITGDEHALPRSAEDSGTASRFIATASGFGFIDLAIIDQHFVKRGRHYRLLNLATRYPDLLGIGIDEATAIIVAPDGTFSILGDSQVLVFNSSHDAAKVDAPSEGQPREPRVYVLASGKRYCMHRQRILQ
jgi:cyanophycinase